MIILKALLENECDIKSVVLSDNNQVGIAELAKSQNINVIIADNVNNIDTVSRIKDFSPELFVLSGFRQILKKRVVRYTINWNN